MDTKHKASAFLISIVLILLGNLFWYFLIQNLSESHILTNSAPQIALSFLSPIALFSLYLSGCALMTVFIRNKLVWLLIVVLSLADYPVLTGLGYYDFLGLAAITSALFFFLVSFQRYEILRNGKTTLSSKVSLSFNSASFIISLTLALNFYSIYSRSLSNSNLIISDALISRVLAPIELIYNDDLKVINPDETFKDYQLRLSRTTKIPPNQVRIYTLQRLDLQTAGDNMRIKDLIKLSLNRYAARLTNQYSKAVSLLISFGLAVIIQTLISLSSTLSNYLTAGLFLGLKKAGLIKAVSKNYSVETFGP